MVCMYTLGVFSKEFGNVQEPKDYFALTKSIYRTPLGDTSLG
jgi:hypothetical protein